MEKLYFSGQRRGRDGTRRALLNWAGMFLILAAMAAQGANDDPTYMPRHCTEVVNGLKGGTYFKIDFFKEWRAFLQEYGDKRQQPAELSDAEFEAYLKYVRQHGTNTVQVDEEKLKPLQFLLTNSDNFWHGQMSVVDYDEAAIAGTEEGKSVVILFGNAGVRVFEDGKCLYNGGLVSGPQNLVLNWQKEIAGQNK